MGSSSQMCHCHNNSFHSVLEKLLQPTRLDLHPSSPTAAKEWQHWHRTFSNFLQECGDWTPNKLKTLVNHVSHNIYQYIEDCTEYESAISILENLYVKAPNEILARHLLATRQQKPGESLDQFLRELRQLSKEFNLKAVSAEQYREDLIRDAFINGVASPLIQQRLLENKTLDLQAAYDQACSIQLAQNFLWEPYSHLFQGFPLASSSVSAASQLPSSVTPATSTVPRQTLAMNRVEINSRPPPTTTAVASTSPATSTRGVGICSQPPTQPGGGGGFTQLNPGTMQGGRGPLLNNNMGGEEKRRPLVPDSQQIFVGNLPHTAGEEELKSEFSRFGKIMDIRLNTAKKMGPKGQVPNFGFITFEEESTVTRVLESRPIHLKGEHRINVEKKKTCLNTEGGKGGPTNGWGGMGVGFRQGSPGGLQGRGGSQPNYNRDKIRGSLRMGKFALE